MWHLYPCVWDGVCSLAASFCGTTQQKRWCGCILDPAQLFKHVVSLWVLTVAVAVGFTCWVFIANQTDSAVDTLSWRMVGVVRNLAVQQAS